MPAGRSPSLQPSSPLARAAVDERRHALELAELAAEIKHVVVAELLGDLLERPVGESDKPARLGDAPLERMVMQRHAGLALKAAPQGAQRHAALLRQYGVVGRGRLR